MQLFKGQSKQTKKPETELSFKCGSTLSSLLYRKCLLLQGVYPNFKELITACASTIIERTDNML